MCLLLALQAWTHWMESQFLCSGPRHASRMCTTPSRRWSKKPSAGTGLPGTGQQAGLPMLPMDRHPRMAAMQRATSSLYIFCGRYQASSQVAMTHPTIFSCHDKAVAYGLTLCPQTSTQSHTGSTTNHDCWFQVDNQAPFMPTVCTLPSPLSNTLSKAAEGPLSKLVC